MPAKNENVNLNVQPGQNGGTGWHTVTLPNSQVYSFKYTGGNDDNGGLKTKTNDGLATIAVSLNGNNNRYSVNSVSFTGDVQPPQLSSTYSAQSASITDQNTANITADYCINVLDSTTGSIIPCDPMIQNDPKNPMPMMQHRIQHS